MTENDLRPRLISLTDGSEVILPETAIFGRKSDSTIPLPDNRVSRRHSMIRRQEDDEFWFYDLGSFNGSYINNERVTTTRQLEPGDIIRICDFEFRFELPQAGPRPGGDAQDMQVVPMLILVSDIKGFTRLSEVLPPDELAQAIGSWYSYCDQVLTEHGAAIDKFIGDAVLAYWTDVTPNARQWALSIDQRSAPHVRSLRAGLRQHGDCDDAAGGQRRRPCDARHLCHGHRHRHRQDTLRGSVARSAAVSRSARGRDEACRQRVRGVTRRFAQ